MNPDHEAYFRALAKKAGDLRADADRIDETIRQSKARPTDWNGPSNPPDPLLPPKSDAWHDAQLVIAGGLAGAALVVLGPHLWELLWSLVP